MIKKVVYIFYSEVYEFEIDKFGLNIMKDNGFNVEGWCMEKVFFPNTYEKRKPPYINEIKILYLEDYRSLIKKITEQKQKETIFLLPLPVHNYRVNIIEAIIKLMGFSYCMLYWQPYLCDATIGSLKYSRLKKIWWENIMDRLFPPLYNFVATKVNFLDYSSKARIVKKNNILIHTLDYDRYLKERTSPPLLQEKYIVFLDEYYPFHTDYQMLGLVNPERDPHIYFELINELFDMVEAQTGYKVIIAEHPRADYSDKEYYLNGRRHYRNETIRLIRDCEFVITHVSLAQSYIVMFNKPFLMIYDERIHSNIEWAFCYQPYINMFHNKPLNLSKPYTWDMVKECISLNEKGSYKKYSKRYIKHKGKDNKLFFQVVADKLKDL